MSLNVLPGQILSVFGPAASGKSFLLEIVARRANPPAGAVIVTESVCVAESPVASRRATPQSIAQGKSKPPSSAGEVTEALEATRLWDDRRRPLAELSPSQLAACALLPGLAGRHALFIVDGFLDHIDPWAFPSTVALLRKRCREGCAAIVASNRPELAQSSDGVLVLDSRRVRFAGSVSDLLRLGPRTQFEIGTDNRPGVRALVNEFAVNVVETEAGLRLEAEPGQELAARLLLEGYGDVKFLVQSNPSVADALRHASLGS